MRVTSLLRNLVNIANVVVRGWRWSADGLEIEVAPRWRKPRCGRCGKVAPGYDRRPSRRWRHSNWGRCLVWLAYARARVECARCGVTLELVPWASGASRSTVVFEEMVAYLAQVTDRTQVSKLMGIAWETATSIVERVVESRMTPERFEGLTSIGVDEFSYRKRHRYVTVVVDHVRRRVVWAGEGRSAATLKQFFELLGPERCAAITTATIDMSAGFQKAIREALPNAEVVFDRFHVASWRAKHSTKCGAPKCEKMTTLRSPARSRRAGTRS